MDKFSHKFLDTRIENIILYKLFYDSEYRHKAMLILKTEYFEEPIGEFPLNVIFSTFKKLYEDNIKKITPTLVYIHIEENEIHLDNEQLDEVADFLDNINETYDNRDDVYDVDIEYVLRETEIFCKDSAMELALMNSIEIIENDKKDKKEIYKLIDEALNVGFDEEIGTNYKKNIEERFKFYQEEEDKIPFSIKTLNSITSQGFPKGTLNCFMAGTGIGKTLFMSSLSVDYLKKGLNVLYITLEISEKRIMMRTDSNLLDIPINEMTNPDSVSPEVLANKFKKIIKKYKLGDFEVKQFPTGSITTLNIKSLIKELEKKDGFKADVIMIDYINLMNSYRLSSKISNSYSIVKAVAEELRGLAVETDTVVITATQVNRQGISGNEVGLDNVSESAGLPHTTDFFCGIYQTEEQRENNVIIIKPLKNRYGKIVNQRYALGIDYDHMRIYQLDREKEDEAVETDLNDDATQVRNIRRRRR